ncbi:MAG: NAD(P)H-dependent oxidoreductase subunit E [bacterium]|nr:NAD(P)H-dependent oxidoreductase subunit E [bacterium]
MDKFVVLNPEEELRLIREEILPGFQPPEPRFLLPVLHEIQARLRYLPLEGLRAVSEYLGLSAAAVWGVATFYPQFRFAPPGQNQVRVCLGTTCHIKGGEAILESWERELKIKTDETTPDRLFSLERVACVGCCSLAPIMTVNDSIVGKSSPISVKGEILKAKTVRGPKTQTNSNDQ